MADVERIAKWLYDEYEDGLVNGGAECICDECWITPPKWSKLPDGDRKRWIDNARELIEFVHNASTH